MDSSLPFAHGRASDKPHFDIDNHFQFEHTANRPLTAPELCRDSRARSKSCFNLSSLFCARDSSPFFS
jgi:hypothetical protein